MCADIERTQAASAAEERLHAVTIGKPDLLNKRIDLKPYNPEWPAMFASLETQIRNALGSKVVMLEHVGSTSVPALSAKPTIDMVLAVADSTDEGSYVPPLERGGFVLRIREADWFQHRLLKSPIIEGNLHVFSSGCEEITRMLVFRDWLRTNADDRKLYEQTKQELAKRHWKYVQEYADAKSEVVKSILNRALGGTSRIPP